MCFTHLEHLASAAIVVLIASLHASWVHYAQQNIKHTMAMHSLSILWQYCWKRVCNVPNEHKATTQNPPHCKYSCANKAIRRLPNRVYIKQTGGLHSCCARPNHLPVAMKSDDSNCTCLRTEKTAIQHPQQIYICVTDYWPYMVSTDYMGFLLCYVRVCT